MRRDQLFLLLGRETFGGVLGGELILQQPVEEPEYAGALANEQPERTLSHIKELVGCPSGVRRGQGKRLGVLQSRHQVLAELA